jgi:hypothetical protein
MRWLKMKPCIKCGSVCKNQHFNTIYCDRCRVIERKRGLKENNDRYHKKHPGLRKKWSRDNNKKRWEKMTPEQKEKEYERKRNEYWKDPEKMREYNRKKYKRWVSSIEGRMMHRSKLWRRRAREKLCDHDFTIQEWNDKLEKTNGICPGFGREPHFVGIDKLTTDHNPPINKAPKGFIYTINDVNPLCGSCNSRKRDKVNEGG